MLLLVPLMVLAACSRYEGPREVYQKNRAGDRADQRGYDIEEQKQRGRERYTYIEDDRAVGPKTYADRPGGVGR
jgi:hypothetical protein